MLKSCKSTETHIWTRGSTMKISRPTAFCCSLKVSGTRLGEPSQEEKTYSAIFLDHFFFCGPLPQVRSVPEGSDLDFYELTIQKNELCLYRRVHYCGAMGAGISSAPLTTFARTGFSGTAAFARKPTPAKIAKKTTSSFTISALHIQACVRASK